ncbi:MAG: BspA family leucine-rich repeat surface protein, partial [Firmicutes bacterium]|nr:BspA family leucine-rich repeat surface protein [Bacillota bacterium]
STFLNTEVLRNQIESITIEKTNVVPNDAKYSKDISSKQDGSVMLWYTDKDNNSLYEISIGSENGSVEANTNGSGMFAYLDNVSTLDLSGLDTSNMTSMNRMFYKSTSLTNIDLSGFDTSKVVNMYGMFWGCNNLKNIDVSNFNTKKVTTMVYMFRECNSLEKLNLSNFDTSNVTRMDSMFLYDGSLTNIDLSNFNTSKVTNMGDMFEDCGQLTELDLSSFDTSNVKIMYYMFKRDKGLKTIYVSDKWNISNVTESAGMFANCTSLTGTVPFDSTKTDITMANYTNGYLTYKKNPN